jgi:hypothetical protein
MMSAHWTRLRQAMVPIAGASILWASVVSTAVAADKTFSSSVSPGPLVAGASYGAGARSASFVTLTLTNESTQARLGSANVTPPAGVVATAATSSVGTSPAPIVGGVIELRNLSLAPGASVSVSISARVECASNHSPYSWGFAVKQANDFNGTGNDLAPVAPQAVNTVAGTCGIEFSKQPASSEDAPTIIRSEIYDPSSDPLTVTVRDAADVDTVTWWSGAINLSIGDNLSGGDPGLAGTAGSGSNGVFTFAPTIDVSSSGYSLLATATPTAGTPSVGTSTAAVESANFNIVDDAAICAANASCTVESQGPKTKVEVEATAAGGEEGDLVILTINDPTLVLDCAGYTETSELVFVNVTESDGVTASGRGFRASMTLPAAFVTKTASKYDVCFESVIPFTTKSGTVALKGLLPACVGKTPTPPCIETKIINKAKDLFIVIVVPPGDPKSNY